ncbi:VCBS repeat-containing protein [Zeaxanthinibacter enoshimensis]|uniref:VCBS repeat protein n=1 Tax=Zeaxanthinibacter enoshimensis TaxID=392009 RepID=A0A4R6TTT3_9FLAO|nr:VCBS repeat-containing protein [Zeaxanthinibacter enoshimensis]TDQ32358.1 VCBS repeat protein [Zeaxanthinibacter enoshimensis]
MRKFSPLFFLIILLCSCESEPETLFKLHTAEETGITFNNRIIETDSANILTEEYIFNGGGVGVGDFDSDGMPDLFFAGNQVPNQLYLNKGKFKFRDVSTEAGITAKDRWNTGVTVVDINTDGKPDIYVCSAREQGAGKRANLLFLNQGNNKDGIPVFKESAADYGIGDPGNSMGAAFFDYDKDGDQDLYVLNNEQVHILPTNYREKITDGSAISNDRLYRNNGDGTFTDVTLEAGITIEGFGLGIAVADLNYDGWPDIYITNDYLTNDLLYINNGDGTFRNDIKDRIRHQSKFSMGSDIADYDNDGLLDIITLDMLGETNSRMKTTIGNNPYITTIMNRKWGYEEQYSRNMLHKGNAADLPFSEIGLMAGVARTDWSWSPLFMDVDNDGYRDLLITNGFPRDITDKDFGDFRVGVSRFLSPQDILDSIPIVKIPNYAYRNKGDWTFEDSGENWGLNVPSFSNGAVFADLDQDGDLDYVVNNINDTAFVFENRLEQQADRPNYLKVRLEGPEGNPMGIGAKLRLKVSDKLVQYHEHQLTRGYMSSVEEMIHFGTGPHQQLDQLEIWWPDGRYEKLVSLKANQTLVLSYRDAVPGENAGPDPFRDPKPMLSAVSKENGLAFKHREQDMIDFNIQRILPHKLTQNGPDMTSGDINGDGLEDFIIGGSSGHSPTLFFQKSDGSFEQQLLFTDKKDLEYEVESMALFDLDNDQDLDLYLVSGSNEFERNSQHYSDRLYINDGNGNYSPAGSRMPDVNSSGSVVSAADFDGDGYTDLFVGGRTPIGKYPMPDKSFLLRNNKGKLEDVTAEKAPGLSEVGMVTDAVWADVDGDKYSDLVVVGEFMAVTIFRNNGSTLTPLKDTGLENYKGWWQSIATADIDNDGDLDFIVGNLGSNNFYQPSEERPVSVLAKDFDNNGSVDPVMFAYFKNDRGDYESFPVHFWGDLYGQSPLFRSKFDFFKDYAKANQENLFKRQELEGALHLTASTDKSMYIENLGNGTFKVKSLPKEAQLAPVTDLLITDLDEDGNKDLLLIGNDYGNEPFIGKYDAFNGLFLKGDGQGNFVAVPAVESGFVVPGDAKSLISIQGSDKRQVFLAGQNRDSLLIFSKSVVPVDSADSI